MLDTDGRLPCPDCRLRFAGDAALRRHAHLDHSPDPDGLELLRQALGAPALPPDWAAVTGTAVVLGWACAFVLVLLGVEA